MPSAGPTAAPSAGPTASPSEVPTASPTAEPSAVPSAMPSAGPTVGPSFSPSVQSLSIVTFTSSFVFSGVTSVLTVEDQYGIRVGVFKSLSLSLSIPSVDYVVFVDSVVVSRRRLLTVGVLDSVLVSTDVSVPLVDNPGYAYNISALSDTVSWSLSSAASDGTLLSNIQGASVSSNSTFASASITGTVVSLSSIQYPPSYAPTAYPTELPSEVPTLSPAHTNDPTVIPSSPPTNVPSLIPTAAPTASPSAAPSASPSATPSCVPTVFPTLLPSMAPSASPTALPSLFPTINPTEVPSMLPSALPSEIPSFSPTETPTGIPTVSPSRLPTACPSEIPTVLPSVLPSADPTLFPSVGPTQLPSVVPSLNPTVVPSVLPTAIPSMVPSQSPTTTSPSAVPTLLPTALPSATPSIIPTVIPTAGPSLIPSLAPSVIPTYSPSFVPTYTITMPPTAAPTKIDTCQLNATTFTISFNSSTPSIVTIKSNLVKACSFSGDLYCLYVLGDTNVVYSDSYFTSNLFVSGTKMTSFVTGSSQLSATISGLIPARDYIIVCGLSLTTGFRSSSQEIVSAKKTFRTLCCRSMTFTTYPISLYNSSRVYLEADSGSGSTSLIGKNLITLTISSLPATSSGGLLIVRPVLIKNGTMISSSYNVFSPASQSFAANSSSLTYSFYLWPEDLVAGINYVVSLTLSGNEVSSYSLSRTVSIRILTASDPLPAPSLKYAWMSDNGASFMVQFDTETDYGGLASPSSTPNTWTCSLLLNFSDAATSTCQWTNRTTIFVTLPTLTATIEQGSYVTLLADLVHGYCPSGSTYITCSNKAAAASQLIVVSSAYNALTPQVILLASNHFSSCTGVELNPTGSSGNGGRSWLSITWTAVLSNGTEVTSVSNYLQSLTATAISNGKGVNQLFSIPSTKLMLSDGTMYYITLTLKNFMGKAGSATAKTSYDSSNGDIPLVAIGGSSSLTVKSSDSLDLQATVSFSPCSLVSKSWQYRWQLVDYTTSSSSTTYSEDSSSALTVTGTSKNPLRLTLPTYYLSAGMLYKVYFVAYSSTSTSVSYGVVNVRVSSGSIIATISGASVRYLTTNSTTLDASRSYDEDTSTVSTSTSSVNSALTYSWSCTTTTLMTTSTSSSSSINRCDSLLIAATSSNSAVRLSAGNMTLNTAYSIQVTVSSTNSITGIKRSATSSTVVIYRLAPVYISTSDSGGGSNGNQTVIQSIEASSSLTMDQTKINADSALLVQAKVEANTAVIAMWEVVTSDGTDESDPLSATDLNALTPLTRSFTKDEASSGISFPLQVSPSGLSSISTIVVKLSIYTTSGSTTSTRMLLGDRNHFAFSMNTRELQTTTWKNLLSSSQISVPINKPPSSGSISITPLTGYNLNTSFTALTFDWVEDASDLPLTYDFRYQVPTSSSMTTVSLYFQSRSSLSSAKTLLPLGYPSQNYSVAVLVTAYDVLLASATTSRSVNVYNVPTSNSGSPGSVSVNFTNVLTQLFDASTTANNVDQKLSAVNVVSTSMTASTVSSTVDCSTKINATYCASLNRLPCSTTAHTCSSCLDDYVGQLGDANTLCVAKVDQQQNKVSNVGDSCTQNQDCLFGICALSTVSSTKICQAPVKSCPMYDGEECSGSDKGTCVYSTGSAATCTVLDTACTVRCSCLTGYSGKDCSLSSDDISERESARKLMCESLIEISQQSDPSTLLTSSLASSMLSVFDPYEVTSSDRGLAVLSLCSEALIKILNVSTNNLDMNTTTSAQYLVDTISNFALASSYINGNDTDQAVFLDEAASTLVMNALAAMVYGQSAVSILSDNFRLKLSKDLVSLLEGQNMSVPRSSEEIYYSQITTTSTSSTDDGDTEVDAITLEFLSGMQESCQDDTGYLSLSVGSWKTGTTPLTTSTSAVFSNDTVSDVSTDVLRSQTTRTLSTSSTSGANYTEVAYRMSFPFSSMQSMFANYSLSKQQVLESISLSEALAVDYQFNYTLPSCLQYETDSETGSIVTMNCQDCVLVSYSNTTVVFDCYNPSLLCSSSSNGRRRLQSSTSTDKDLSDYSVSTIYETATMLTYFDTQLLKTVTLNPFAIDWYHAKIVVSVVATMLGLYLIGCVYFLTWDREDRLRLLYVTGVADVMDAKVNKFEKAKSTKFLMQRALSENNSGHGLDGVNLFRRPSKRQASVTKNLLSIIKDAMPLEFTSASTTKKDDPLSSTPTNTPLSAAWYDNFLKPIFRFHQYARLFAEEASLSSTRVLRYTNIVIHLFINIFVDTVFFQLAYIDDGTCEQYTTESSCEHGVNSMTGQQTCTWGSQSSSTGGSDSVSVSVDAHCYLTSPPSSITFIVVLSIITLIVSYPLGFLYDYLILEVCNKRPDLDFFGISTVQWLGLATYDLLHVDEEQRAKQQLEEFERQSKAWKLKEGAMLASTEHAPAHHGTDGADNHDLTKSSSTMSGEHVMLMELLKPLSLRGGIKVQNNTNPQGGQAVTSDVGVYRRNVKNYRRTAGVDANTSVKSNRSNSSRKSGKLKRTKSSAGSVFLEQTDSLVHDLTSCLKFFDSCAVEAEKRHLLADIIAYFSDPVNRPKPTGLFVPNQTGSGKGANSVSATASASQYHALALQVKEVLGIDVTKLAKEIKKIESLSIDTKSKLDQLLKHARQRALEIEDEIKHYHFGNTKENQQYDALTALTDPNKALIQYFILEQLPPMRRIILRNYCFEFANISPPKVNPILWIFAWLFVIASVFFFFYWILMWGLLYGGRAFRAWGMNFIMNFVQQVMMVDLFTVYFIHIATQSAIVPRLQSIRRVLEEVALQRALQSCTGCADHPPSVPDTIPVRGGGVSFAPLPESVNHSHNHNLQDHLLPQVSLVQHTSPICRVARKNAFSSLAAAHLLLHINDSDIYACQHNHLITSAAVHVNLGLITVLLLAIPAWISTFSEPLAQPMYNFCTASIILSGYVMFGFLFQYYTKIFLIIVCSLIALKILSVRLSHYHWKRKQRRLFKRLGLLGVQTSFDTWSSKNATRLRQQVTKQSRSVWKRFKQGVAKLMPRPLLATKYSVMALRVVGIVTGSTAATSGAGAILVADDELNPYRQRQGELTSCWRNMNDCTIRGIFAATSCYPPPLPNEDDIEEQIESGAVGPNTPATASSPFSPNWGLGRMLSNFLGSPAKPKANARGMKKHHLLTTPSMLLSTKYHLLDLHLEKITKDIQRMSLMAIDEESLKFIYRGPKEKIFDVIDGISYFDMDAIKAIEEETPADEQKDDQVDQNDAEGSQDENDDDDAESEQDSDEAVQEDEPSSARIAFQQQRADANSSNHAHKSIRKNKKSKRPESTRSVKSTQDGNSNRLSIRQSLIVNKKMKIKSKPVISNATNAPVGAIVPSTDPRKTPTPPPDPNVFNMHDIYDDAKDGDKSRYRRSYQWMPISPFTQPPKQTPTSKADTPKRLHRLVSSIKHIVNRSTKSRSTHSHVNSAIGSYPIGKHRLITYQMKHFRTINVVDATLHVLSEYFLTHTAPINIPTIGTSTSNKSPPSSPARSRNSSPMKTPASPSLNDKLAPAPPIRELSKKSSIRSMTLAYIASDSDDSGDESKKKDDGKKSTKNSKKSQSKSPQSTKTTTAKADTTIYKPALSLVEQLQEQLLATTLSYDPEEEAMKERVKKYREQQELHKKQSVLNQEIAQRELLELIEDFMQFSQEMSILPTADGSNDHGTQGYDHMEFHVSPATALSSNSISGIMSANVSANASVHGSESESEQGNVTESQTTSQKKRNRLSRLSSLPFNQDKEDNHRVVGFLLESSKSSSKSTEDDEVVAINATGGKKKTMLTHAEVMTHAESSAFNLVTNSSNKKDKGSGSVGLSSTMYVSGKAVLNKKLAGGVIHHRSRSNSDSGNTSQKGSGSGRASISPSHVGIAEESEEGEEQRVEAVEEQEDSEPVVNSEGNVDVHDDKNHMSNKTEKNEKAVIVKPKMTLTRKSSSSRLKDPFSDVKPTLLQTTTLTFEQVKCLLDRFLIVYTPEKDLPLTIEEKNEIYELFWQWIVHLASSPFYDCPYEEIELPVKLFVTWLLHIDRLIKMKSPIRVVQRGKK